MLHLFPVYQPFAFAVEFYGEPHDLTLVSLEWLCVAALAYLVEFNPIDKFPDYVCLVNIEVAVSSYLHKRLDANG